MKDIHVSHGDTTHELGAPCKNCEEVQRQFLDLLKSMDFSKDGKNNSPFIRHLLQNCGFRLNNLSHTLELTLMRSFLVTPTIITSLDLEDGKAMLVKHVESMRDAFLKKFDDLIFNIRSYEESEDELLKALLDDSRR